MSMHKSDNLPIYLVDLIPPSKVGGKKFFLCVFMQTVKRHDFLSIFLMMPLRGNIVKGYFHHSI
jgi:hypothetical protein